MDRILIFSCPVRLQQQMVQCLDIYKRLRPTNEIWLTVLCPARSRVSRHLSLHVPDGSLPFVPPHPDLLASASIKVKERHLDLTCLIGIGPTSSY